MSSAQIDSMFQSAVQLHQGNKLSEVDLLCRNILTLQADHPSATYLIGLVAAQEGRYEVAEEFLRKSIRLIPNGSDAHLNLGFVLMRLGKASNAVECCRKAVVLSPDSVAGWGNLGDAELMSGNVDAGIQAYERSLKLNPNNAPVINSLAVALFQKGQIEAAITTGRRALSLDRNYLTAYTNLATFLARSNRYPEAVTVLQAALPLAPNLADLHLNLGQALAASGKPAEAMISLRRAVALAPNLIPARNSLAAVMTKEGQTDEALTLIRQVMATAPNDLDTVINLGNTLHWQGRMEESLAAFDRAIALNPDHVGAHCDRAISNLKLGRYEEGWREYEWRFRNPSLDMTARGMNIPRWDGANLAGKRILLKSEQGLGDTLQFIRYAPLVAKRGGRIVLECDPLLVKLLGRVAGIEQIVTPDQPLPAVDCCSPLLSLPGIFGTTVDNVPIEIPYLQPAAADVEAWRERLPAASGRQRVGLCWAGRPSYTHDRVRSTSLATFAPLASISGVDLVSLQKGAASSDILPQSLKLIDLTAHLHDFSDTAALIAHLDLVITVDTAVAHLAAAMGKPTWILLPFNNDWRWLTNRNDSPWYPSVQLFRQERSGGWHPVVAKLAAELQQRVMGSVNSIWNQPAPTAQAKTIRFLAGR